MRTYAKKKPQKLSEIPQSAHKIGHIEIYAQLNFLFIEPEKKNLFPQCHVDIPKR